MSINFIKTLVPAGEHRLNDLKEVNFSVECGMSFDSPRISSEAGLFMRSILDACFHGIKVAKFLVSHLSRMKAPGYSLE